MSNRVVEDKYTSIIDAVGYWLGYQFKIGREQLIHEASLRYPIADTITAKGISVNRIILEKLHPLFKSKKIDLVIFDETVDEPATENDDTKLKEVYEFKLAKSDMAKEQSDEHQRIFDDVVRLGYYNKWGKKECYFLMCGRYEEFKTYFVGQERVMKNEAGKNIVPVRRKAKQENLAQQILDDPWKPDGLYKDWFGFKIGESKTIEFTINQSMPTGTWGLKRFQEEYKIRNEDKHFFSNSIKITTTCLAITPPGEKNRTHAAGIWKVESIN
ncbi:hypothetical protein [Mucilaginibacter psychrotolerans]|uniref:Uncharacterized protein n=1 Tax=Mucilaginibacter psychrotolerans TaxID=1524096 RepID=A0A4Y8SND7_9SPHI|nr:hypothetical protein [Mucilaginibacter psychrotolerans]TFF40633.1 hypothetical protein E2R66_00155 [Mucilaginibacter psychrotolerans]